MGREIRHVPPHWEHPKYTYETAPHSSRVGDYHPLYNKSFKQAAAQWKEEFAAWERGERPSYCSEESKSDEFWVYHGNPPKPDYYRPDWKEGEATWIQVYETVSEGTPVTPPFATEDELIDYLVAHGDFWDQKRRLEGRLGMNCQPWSRMQAEKFVKGAGWAPSLVFTPETGLVSGVEAMAKLGE